MRSFGPHLPVLSAYNWLCIQGITLSGALETIFGAGDETGAILIPELSL